MDRYLSVRFFSSMRRNECKTEMSMKLYARSMNLSFVLLIARAVKMELSPVLQIRFQAK